MVQKRDGPLRTVHIKKKKTTKKKHENIKMRGDKIPTDRGNR